MAITQGQRTAPSYTTGERQKKEIENKLLWVNPREYVFLSYLSGAQMWAPDGRPGWTPLKPRPSRGPVFEVFEQTGRTHRLTLSASATAAATTLNVTNANEVLPADLAIVYNNGANGDLERIRIIAVNTTTKALTVVRGQGGSTAAPLADGAKLLIMAANIGEGCIAARGAIHITPDSHFGCCQHHREELKATSEAVSCTNYWGDDWPQDKFSAINALKTKAEHLLWFNGNADKSSTSTISSSISNEYGGVTYTSAGFLARCQTHNYAHPNATFSDLQDYFNTYFIFNRANQMARPVGMLPQYSFSHINEWGNNLLITRVQDNQFGFLSGYLKIAGPVNGAIPLYLCPVMNEGPLERGIAFPSMGVSQEGVPHMGIRYLQEGAPRNTAWGMFGADGDGVDITPVGLTTVILRAFEWFAGLQMNLEMLSMVLRQFS